VSVLASILIIAVLAVNVIHVLYRGRLIQAGDPLAVYISCSCCVAFLVYTWKNKFELLKRCILAAPFVPIFAIAFRIAKFETVFSIHGGILIFLFLVVETDNWKRHFFITLMTAAIFIFLLACFPREDFNVYKISFISGLSLLLGYAYIAYICTLYSPYSLKTIRLRNLAVKSIMFSGIVLSVTTLLLISRFSLRHHRYGFGITVLISVLFALGFLGFCYLFNISFSHIYDSNKNNEIKNKKYINKQRMMSSVFRGKDDKTNNAGKCALCGKSIYNSEESHAIKDHTFCGQCYKKIEEEKTRIT
jgi:hypothetical protein